ncbi:hypothetical protein UFOVP546_4 [uncultured Caudovirales phage]|uniref:Holin n=1 Tax=uncultured Caudovirales phage TaxID=2100421 RepID=A0A6J5MRX9_9CAUD|nr:hypothetical protein UFOVP546_4 [uncultured Caudovirales phage]
MWLDIARRTFAVIILKVTGIFVGGAVIGLQVKDAIAMAAFAGIIDVSQELSRSYLADGKLDPEEINKSFGKIAESSKKKTPKK